MVNGTNKTCVDNTNSGCGLETGIFPEFYMYTAIFLAAAVSIVSGNILVVIVYYKKESLRTLSNFIVMQLAYADLSIAVGIIYHVYTLYIPYLDSNSLFCVTRYSVLWFPVCATNFLLVLLSIDRWVTIAHPYQHTNIMTPKVVYSAALSCWLMAATLTGVCPIIFKLYTLTTRLEVCGMIVGLTPQYFSYVGLPIIAACLTVIIIIYIKIYIIVRKKKATEKHLVVTVAPHGEQNHDHMIGIQHAINDAICAQKKLIKQEVKTFKTLGIILSSFVGCWTPFSLMTLVEIILEIPPDHMFGAFRGFVGLLALFNAITNPFIYAKKMADFRTEFRKLLCHKVQPHQTRS